MDTTIAREYQLCWPDGTSYIYWRNGRWRFTREEAESLARYEGNLTIIPPAA